MRGCRPTATNVEAGGYDGVPPVTIPPLRRREAGHIGLHMPNSVVDACQDAAFTIRFTVDAIRVGR